MKPTITIRLANNIDRKAVGDFRNEQFKTAKEFKVLDESLFYELHGMVLIAEIGTDIISTMQVQLVNDIDALHKTSASVIPSDFSIFPTYYLSKGATKTDYRNTGINSYLRLLTLELATVQNIQSLIGVAYEGAPRLNLLKKLGYTTTTIIDKGFKNLVPVLFLTLERANFIKAAEILKLETLQLTNEYIIDNCINLGDKHYLPS